MTYLNKILGILILVSIYSCNQKINQLNNMKWTKYDFNDIYKLDLEKELDPISDLNFGDFAMTNDSTILIAAQKDDTLNGGNHGILFLSENKGKTFKEIKLTDALIEQIIVGSKYTVIVASDIILNKRSVELFSFDNRTREITPLCKRNAIKNLSVLDETVLFQSGDTLNVINIKSKEETEIFTTVLANEYYQFNDEEIVYFDVAMKAIINYNYVTKKNKILHTLKIGSPQFHLSKNTKTGELLLSTIEDKILSVYNMNSSILVKTKIDCSDFCFYDNFLCKVYYNHTKTIIVYSYDYGTSWTTYAVQDCFVQPNPIRFYKDKNILFIGVLNGANNNVGGRFFIGDFKRYLFN